MEPADAPVLVPATADDALRLAEMNKRLIDDEGSRNPMSVAQLERRMRGMLADGFRADFLTIDGEIVGYALHRLLADNYDASLTVGYIRQLYIEREWRRRGLGRRLFESLMRDRFAGSVRVRIDVLESNPGGRAFWGSLGFAPYCTTMHAEAPAQA